MSFVSQKNNMMILLIYAVVPNVVAMNVKVNMHRLGIIVISFKVVANKQWEGNIFQKGTLKKMAN